MSATMLVLVKLGIGFLAGMGLFWVISRNRRDSAVTEANRIKEEAKKEAEHLIREGKVSAKAEVLKLRENFENEIKERKREQNKLEQRLDAREENLDKKFDLLDSRYDLIEKKEQELKNARERASAKEEDLKEKIDRQIIELQKIAELDRESARQMLFSK
ncbi:MAG: Rnase Y domain-containing protein, partial [Victivallales bacterium]|nr:Rnase Y domain-containing protein [Victivallales bacterium]